MVDDKSKLVCIHDAVRPFITKDIIKFCIEECQKFDGAILGVKSTDTVKLSKNVEDNDFLNAFVYHNANYFIKCIA